MKNHPTRREFLKASVVAGCGVGLAGLPAAGASAAAETSGKIKKAVLISMLPEKLSFADRFKMARDVGFEAIEAQTVTDPHVAEEIKKAAEDEKIRIHSVMNMAHWEYPLSSSDPAVVEKSIEGMKTSLHNAKLWGADTVLLVPGVVNPQTSYHEAWTRSQKQIRQLLPLAEELKVVIAVEEVWNKFLLSPLEFPRYVDEFKSPWVRAYFDVGNVLLYGYPQDWIHTLSKRIAKVHLKDFKHLEDGYRWVNLGEGDIDWPAVRKAFADVGYTGYATTELEGGDEAYLRDVSQRVDRLVLGA
ncbi:MAG: sugar phosphate isomerase/epimerase [Acidobacteriia bacterium]|nr:sugar phosphate isomerase/epimerase [Terriglobia bacterium]